MAKAESKQIWVRATTVCFIEGHRRREGAEFPLSDKRFFNKKAMVRIEAPSTDDGSIETDDDGNIEITAQSTKPQIIAALADAGITHATSASKKELLELWFDNDESDDGLS